MVDQTQLQTGNAKSSHLHCHPSLLIVDVDRNNFQHDAHGKREICARPNMVYRTFLFYLPLHIQPIQKHPLVLQSLYHHNPRVGHIYIIKARRRRIYS